MRKIEEFLKRGLIVGLVIVSLAGIATPLQTVYAATNNTVTSMSVTQSNHKGTTGHVTSVTTKESDWEYATPQYVITNLSLPLNYTNPWYSKGSADGAKAVKGYYYLGTVIYNDATSGSSKSSSSGSLSSDEQQNYDDLKSTYTATLKKGKANGLSDSKAKYNAEAALLSQGIRYGSTQLPLIYEMITGKTFDFQYWYDEGINGIEDYASYKSSKSSSSVKVSQGKENNYAKGVTVSGYDASIAKVYKEVVKGEARVYVQGLKKGTTTLKIKTTLNDGKTVEYKTKVTVGSAGTAIKYQTAVNPLSYAAYAMAKDGANYLGYLDKFGGMYTTHSFVDTGTIGQSEQTGGKDYLSVYDHSNYSGMSNKDYYKFNKIDNSQFMKDFLAECGAYDMLDAGKTEYEVYDAVTTAMTNKLQSNIENDLTSGGNSRHYSLEKYLDGYDMACGDEAAISAGICEALGFNWFTQSIANDVANLAILDGKVYEVSSGGANYVEDYNSRLNIASSYSKLEDISLEDLLSGNVVLNISASSSGTNMGVYYKVSDTYEAGRFQYGADTSNVKVDNSYGVLAANQGDVRLLTFHAGVNPQWNKDANDTVSFRYTVPYMERAYYTLKKGATQQLNLVNADWSDFSLKTSNSAVATVSSTGKITMKGSGTATITLTSKKISGLSIKVLVSTSSVTASTAKEKAGTFYSKNDSIYSGDTTNIIAGNYMRIHQ